MEGPKRPCAAASFNWLDIIINPPRELSLGRDFKSFHEAHLGGWDERSWIFEYEKKWKAWDKNIKRKGTFPAVNQILSVVGRSRGCRRSDASRLYPILGPALSEVPLLSLEAYLRAAPIYVNWSWGQKTCPLAERNEQTQYLDDWFSCYFTVDIQIISNIRIDFLLYKYH